MQLSSNSPATLPFFVILISTPILLLSPSSITSRNFSNTSLPTFILLTPTFNYQHCTNTVSIPTNTLLISTPTPTHTHTHTPTPTQRISRLCYIPSRTYICSTQPAFGLSSCPTSGFSILVIAKLPPFHSQTAFHYFTPPSPSRLPDPDYYEDSSYDSEGSSYDSEDSLQSSYTTIVDPPESPGSPESIMPSFIRRVSLNPIPVYSRLPRDDEAYVMKSFAHHASQCSSCDQPYEVYRRGGTLCPKGHQRALDVAQYVYNKGGQAYSLVDREGNQRVQIEIPVGCESVRSLLKAMERGLRIMKNPPVSHDRTYYVPSRPTPERDSRHVKPRLETSLPPRTASPPRRDPNKRYIGRGSMFESDMKEREQYYSTKAPVYYRVSQAPAVPSKDYYSSRYWR